MQSLSTLHNTKDLSAPPCRNLPGSHSEVKPVTVPNTSHGCYLAEVLRSEQASSTHPNMYDTGLLSIGTLPLGLIVLCLYACV